MRLGILCDGASGVTMNLASVTDRSFLIGAARQAILEAQQRAELEEDQRLSVVRSLEVARLRATLFELIPELRSTGLIM
jgi:hypothetical protein